MGSFMVPRPNMGQVPTGGAGRPPMAGGVSVPRTTPPVPRVQAPAVARRPVGRPGSAEPATAGQRIMGTGRTGAAVNRLAPMGPTRGGAAPQRGFGGKLAAALRTGGGRARRSPFAVKLASAAPRLAQMGARGPAAALAREPASGAGTAPGGGGARPMSNIAAGALGGMWNANPDLVSQATKYLKAGAELAPAQRGSLDRVVRQTDRPMMRMAR